MSFLDKMFEQMDFGRGIYNPPYNDHLPRAFDKPIEWISQFLGLQPGLVKLEQKISKAAPTWGSSSTTSQVEISGNFTPKQHDIIVAILNRII